jgi:hypothetical protein
LHSGPLGVRFTIAVLVLPTALIGMAITPLAQLVVLAAILIGGATVDGALTNRRSVR